MSTTVLARLEWRRLFATPFGWMALAVATMLMSWDFLSRIDGWLIAQEAERLGGATLTDAVVMPVVAQASQLILVLAALLSFRAFSDDRRSGTDALLLSAPVNRLALVVGKHAGQWLLPLLLIGSVAAMGASLESGTDLDWGRLAAALVGLVGLALTATAIAVLISTLATQPALGATVSFGVLLGLWLADFAPRSRGVVDSPLEAISLGAQFRPFLSGLVHSSSLIYFLGLTIGCLALASVTLSPLPRRSRWLRGGLIVLATAAALAMGSRMDGRWDWTATGRNSISDASQQVLDALTGPVQIDVFASSDRRLRQAINRFLTPYRQYKPDLTVQFHDPAAEPELVRRHDLRVDGELRLQHQERQESLRTLSETDLAHALQRLARAEDHLVAYTWGSGERDLRGVTPFDLGRFGEALETRGVQVQQLDLLLTPRIPDNLDLLILSQPRQSLMPGVVDAIRSYLRSGGQLLWLADPGGLTGLETLAEDLGLIPLPGVVVDARAEEFGLDNPRMAVAVDYPEHPVSREFNQPSVFPLSLAWEQTESDWVGSPLVRTHRSSWTETGTIEGQIGFDQDGVERAGPLNLGFAMSQGEQRVVVFGDADFLSNQYVGIAGNLDLGLRVINWLLADEALIEIPARVEADTRLQLSRPVLGAIGLLWLGIIPGGCALVAAIIAWRRRRA